MVLAKLKCARATTAVVVMANFILRYLWSLQLLTGCDGGKHSNYLAREMCLGDWRILLGERA